MNIEITNGQIDSQVSKTKIFADTKGLSLANGLLEWNQNNNNVRR